MVVWMHGGGFVGGTKEELAGYFKLLASNGFAVVAAPLLTAGPARVPGEMPGTCGGLLKEKRKSHPGKAENS